MFRGNTGQSQLNAVVITFRWKDIGTRGSAGWRASGRFGIGGAQAGEKIVKTGERFIDAFAWIDNDEGLSDARVEDGGILDDVIDPPAIIASFESEPWVDLIIEAERVFMLLIRLQPRCDAFFCVGTSRARSRKRAEVLVLKEGEAGRSGATKVRLARRVWADAVAITRAENGNDGIYVCSIQGVVALLPELSAERTDGQIEFHLVVELAVAAEDFHFAIAERIPRYTDARRDFIGPAEIDWRADAAAGLIFRG